MSERSGYGAGGRRLPVYLLLDCSGSMRAEAIEALKEGMKLVYDELMDDPESRSKVHISVITFSDGAEQTDLVPIKSFVPPAVKAEGVTRLDGALNLLIQSIESDIRENTPTARGDYCPLVFLLTDGRPTDEHGYESDAYRGELARIKELRYNRKPTIIALGCGSDVSEAILHELTPNVLLMKDVSPEKLRAFFQFISGSVQASAHAAESGSDAAFGPLPAGIVYSPSGGSGGVA